MSIFPAISYDPIRVEPPADYPWDWLKRMIEMHRRARPFFRGDFYPLLDYVHSNQHWGAVQYHRPATGDGMVQAFRRPDSPLVRAEFRLCGLDPAATYEIASFDEAGARKVSGEDLMEKGLTVEINNQPGAAVIMYKAKQSGITKESYDRTLSAGTGRQTSGHGAAIVSCQPPARGSE
jgi:hypothetical protein